MLPRCSVARAATRAWIDEVVKTVGLTERLKHRAASCREVAARVAVARAWPASPTLISLTKPTGNLDSRTGAEILDFMRRAGGPSTARRS
jgi:putative ABC transport system ATP-binding protein